MCLSFPKNASSYDNDALMRLTVHTVDATGVHSAPCTRQDKDTSCWTTYNAGALRRRLAVVLTEAGGIITADIIKTSPLHAVIVPLKRLRLQHSHRVPQHHPMVYAQFFVVSALFGCSWLIITKEIFVTGK